MPVVLRGISRSEVAEQKENTNIVLGLEDQARRIKTYHGQEAPFERSEDDGGHHDRPNYLHKFSPKNAAKTSYASLALSASLRSL